MSDEIRQMFSFIPHPSSLIRKLRRALRGDVTWREALLEACRRGGAAVAGRRERALVARGEVTPARPVSLRAEFARMSASELLAHFRTRERPVFLHGFELPSDELARTQRAEFPEATEQLIESARRIVEEHAWPLLGYGVRSFGSPVDWLRDPLSGSEWPPVYHRDVKIQRGDGSDVRVLWELNRLSHLVTLGRAYAVTGDEQLAEEFFSQVESWRVQNPVGRGANWTCAMEAALRATNLLAAFRLFRRSPRLTETRLSALLELFDAHGAHIRRNLEFSYLVTSNHYLSDVVGLLWLGVCLPELEAARGWREFGLREMLREMDKQVLADGADAEASTGYHRLVTELFLYSFLLCRANRIEIDERHWQTLRAMLEYVNSYLRPDGRAPLIGDTDSGRFLPIARRAADEHAYLLAVGAAVFREPRWKATVVAAARDESATPEEVLWLLGVEGLEAYRALEDAEEASVSSRAFPDAGTYVMRASDLYLLFNASGAGLGGRGSHGHNDALSIEVSACGASLISDAGTYVYTGDLAARHLFRSTAYHSTVEVDGEEQNTTDARAPFVIGDEARARAVGWESTKTRDRVEAAHEGYLRLASGAVAHRRVVTFDKPGRLWLVEDVLTGAGAHTFRFFFHFAPGTRASVRADGIVEVCDKMAHACLLLVALDVRERPTLEARWSSRDYGERTETRAACWTLRRSAPLRARWALVPVCAGEDERARLSRVENLQA
ncbi:MAG TPA: alginate lyase family protein [Pyrinomonadaceae bacterium]|nr:alginate lyase family protein [Pyrinomonadaceae bacterium]